MGVLQGKDNTYFTLLETSIPGSCCHKHYSEKDDVEQLGLVKITSLFDDLILLFISSDGYIICLGLHVLLILKVSKYYHRGGGMTKMTRREKFLVLINIYVTLQNWKASPLILLHA